MARSTSTLSILFLAGFSCLMVKQFSVPATELRNSMRGDDITEQAPLPLKFYAIHIGPSKTGTSAIQKDLASNPFGVNTMGEDNLIYVGKRMWQAGNDPNSSNEVRKVDGIKRRPRDENKAHNEGVKCMTTLLKDLYKNLNTSDSNRTAIDALLETNEAIRASLRQDFIDTCWRKKHSTKDYSYMLNYSIIDSSETNSYSLETMEKLALRFRVFDILGYKRLVVIGAYRRYAEWLVSAYTESIKNISLRPNLKGEMKMTPALSIQKFLNVHLSLSDRSKSTQDKYSINLNRKHYKNIHATLPLVLKHGPSKLEAKILSFFKRSKYSNTTNIESDEEVFGSITTELYCSALGKELTPHTCAHARIVEHSDVVDKNASSTSVDTASSLVQNKGSTSKAVYQHIVSAGYRLGFLLPTDEDVKNEQSLQKQCSKTWCEPMKECVRNMELCQKAEEKKRAELDKVTSHGTISVVGTSNSSVPRLWTDLSHYHTNVHKSTWTKSLPILCPAKNVLEDLLQLSLDFEELVLPDFYATPLGKAEHTRLFWDVWLEQKKLYCWVDIKRLFQNATSWEEIIDERMVNYDWGMPREAVANNEGASAFQFTPGYQ